MSKRCVKCRYFDLTTFERGMRESWCRRYPPSYVGTDRDKPYDYLAADMSRWEDPMVGVNHWCGEWKKRKGKK